MTRPDAACPADLVVTCFERTVGDVLAPGFFDHIEADNRRRFACRTALINNVADRDAVAALAQERIAAGDLDRAVFVADQLDAALARTGLSRDRLGEPQYFTDWALVAVCLDGPDLLLHWDADVRLREACDWVGDAVALLERDARVIAANPNWEVDNLADFEVETEGPFTLGPGFSDQVFLARRADLARPIYEQRCLARWRYPFPDSFEARLDAHLRHAGRLRATHRGAVYLHPVAMGTSWPGRTLADRARFAARHAAVGALRRTPKRVRPSHLRQL